MRLARHGTAGAERPLISGADGAWHDPRPVVGDLTPDTRPTVLDGVGLDDGLGRRRQILGQG
jgi:hypothetical protein